MHHVVDLDVTIVIIAPPAGEEGEVHALFKQWLKKKKKTNSTDDYTFVVYVGNECPVGMFLHTHTHTPMQTHISVHTQWLFV